MASATRRCRRCAAERGQIGEQRLADLFVHEAEHDLTAAVLPFHQGRVLGLFERVEQCVLVEAGDGQEQLEAHAAPDHRGRGERLAHVVADPLEPALDHESHRARDLGVGDLERRAPMAVVVEELAALLEVEEHLLHEERVPLRLVVHERHQRVGRRLTGSARQQLRDIGLRQRREMDLGRQAAPGQILQRTREAVTGPDLTRPVGPDQQQAGARPRSARAR